MGELVPTNDISEEDYQAIQEAVMETARGRWFLAEYARRNRVADTDKVLNAIEGVKTYITREHEPGDVMQMRLNIVDMTQKIEQIKSEIANTDHSSPNISDAQIELNVVLDETEVATSTILSSAEQIQGLGWEIRERGGSDAECDKIDEYATEIYMACSFQDLTGQRLRKVVGLIEVLETSLNAMVSLWDESELERYREEPEIESGDAALTNGPAIPGLAQGQDLIDDVMGETQGININDVGFDEIQWDDSDDEHEEPAPFIIEDELDDINMENAAPEIDITPEVDVALEAETTPQAESLPETEAETETETEIDEIAAFEADASEEAIEAQAETQDNMDNMIDTPAQQESDLEEMAPLEERVAIFN